MGLQHLGIVRNKVMRRQTTQLLITYAIIQKKRDRKDFAKGYG